MPVRFQETGGIMGQRISKPIFLRLIFFACLFPTAAVSAQDAALTFPHFACGDGINIDVNLTNPSPHIEKGSLLFFDERGNPMSLIVDGVQTSRANFFLPAGGARKFKIGGTDKLQVGYALVVAENAASSLVGNLVFTVNKLFDLSVPDSRPTNSARLFMERNQEVNSGYAVLNRGDHEITISLLVRDQDGVQIGEDSLKLAPGEKVSGFLDNLLGSQFIGSLEASCASPFYILGLRQRPTGSVAALPVAVSPGPIVGSQLLYYVDTGIDLRTGGYSEEALNSKTVYELTGLTKANNPTAIKIANNNRSQAVTLHVYFLNDKARDYLDFLLVLKCGETLTFDPFDFEIPGTNGLKTSNFLFGYGLTDTVADEFPAAHFGSGRFVLSVLAVGAAIDQDSVPDLLYPNEAAMIGFCGVTPRNTGSESGFSSANLHVYNALPIIFDYLSGNHLYAPAGLDGPMFRADVTLQAISLFTRAPVPMPGALKGFLTLADPGKSDLFDYMAGQKGPTAGTLVLPSTAVFTWGSAPFTFLPGGR